MAALPLARQLVSATVLPDHPLWASVDQLSGTMISGGRPLSTGLSGDVVLLALGFFEPHEFFFFLRKRLDLKTIFGP